MSSYILSEFLVLDKEEQQCRQMMAGLDKVVSDLDKQEKAIYTRVRPPLEQTRPVQDSADRLQDLRVIIFYFTTMLVLNAPLRGLTIPKRTNLHLGHCYCCQ